MNVLAIRVAIVAAARAAVEAEWTEDPVGSNDGPTLAPIWALVPNGKGAPWCAAFASYCVLTGFNAQGAQFPHGAMTAVAAWKQYAYDRGLGTTDPHAGDLVIYREGSHMGVIIAVEPTGLTVCEGNYSNRVSSVRRKMSEAALFISVVPVAPPGQQDNLDRASSPPSIVRGPTAAALDPSRPGLAVTKRGLNLAPLPGGVSVYRSHCCFGPNDLVLSYAPSGRDGIPMSSGAGSFHALWPASKSILMVDARLRAQGRAKATFPFEWMGDVALPSSIGQLASSPGNGRSRLSHPLTRRAGLLFCLSPREIVSAAAVSRVASDLGIPGTVATCFAEDIVGREHHVIQGHFGCAAFVCPDEPGDEHGASALARSAASRWRAACIGEGIETPSGWGPFQSLRTEYRGCEPAEATAYPSARRPIPVVPSSISASLLTMVAEEASTIRRKGT